MDHMLRCNSLKCRTELGKKALVTTCSHIFCTDCATRLGLMNPGEMQLCPACSSPLTNLDDAVVTDLNPSEDYKTSVLSGLSPTVIIECASRGLSFWAYQTIQEVTYQEYLGKTLTEKYTNLSVHLEKVIGDANAQITNLNNKMANLSFDQQALRRRNEELSQALKDKNRKLLQTQELYDKLKRKAMMGQMQLAAEDVIGSNLPTSAGMDTGGSLQEEERVPLDSYQDALPAYQQQHYQPMSTRGPSSIYQARTKPQINNGTWGKSTGKPSEIPLTPSTHRQRIGEHSDLGLPNVPGLVARPYSPRHTMNIQHPMDEPSTNHRSNAKFPAIGLSSGLKSSHNGGAFNDLAVPNARPRAIKRPAQHAFRPARGDTDHQSESGLGNIQSTSIAGGVHGVFTSH